MRRLLVVGAVLLIAGMFTVFWTVGHWRDRVSAENLEQYISQLGSANAYMRLRAAIGVLRLDPMHPDAELIGAKALFEIGRYAQAKRVLLKLEHEKDDSGRTEAMLLRAKVSLAQGADVVANTTPQSVDAAEPKLEALLDEAEGVFDSLRDDPLSDSKVTRLKAHSAYLRVALLRLKLHGQQSSLTKVEAIGFDNRHVKGLKDTISDLRGRISTLDHQLIDFCHRAIAQDPSDSDPRRLLFLMWVDARSFDRVRGVAAEVAKMPRLEASLAGKIANTLLDWEGHCQQQTTREDIEISRGLLTHPHLIRVEDIDYRVAVIRLALLDKRYQEAKQLAMGVLRDFRDHPRTVCLLAFAMIGLGEAPQAVGLLGPLNRRVRSANIRYALGVASLGAGQVEQGRDLLRQSSEIQTNHLPAVVALAESFVDAGFVVEAEPEIREAIRLSPDHPWVVKLQLQLFIEQLDRVGISGMLADKISGDRSLLRWRDVAMATAMMLGDTAIVSKCIEQLEESDPDRMMALAGICWQRSQPQNRFEMSAILVRLLLEVLDADPLLRSGPPGVPVFERRITAETVGGVESLCTTYYVRRPQQDAMRLVELAIGQWPDQPVLLDLAARLCVWADKPDGVGRYLKELVDTGVPLSATAQGLLTAYLSTDPFQGSTPSQGMPVINEPGGAAAAFHYVMLKAALRHQDKQAARKRLMSLLTRVGWAERALVATVRDAMERGGPEQARGWLEVAKQVNPRLALLVGARFNLARGQFVDALHDLKTFLRDEDRASEARRAAAEVLAQIGIAIGQLNIAVSMFEDLALSSHDQKIAMHIAVVDLLLTGGHTKSAIAALTVMLEKPPQSLGWLDHLLVRAEGVMKPHRMQRLIDQLLKAQPKSLLLLLYQARNMARMGDMDEADQLLQSVLKIRPQAPRVLFAMAKLAVERGDIQKARGLYRRLIERGDSASMKAREELDRLDGAGDTLIDPIPGVGGAG